MTGSHFKTFNLGQDHVSGVALSAKTEGGSRWATAVIGILFRGLTTSIQRSLSRRSLTAKSED